MIPEMIVRRLPEGLDLEKVSEFVQLGSAPDGKLGETLLLLRPGGLLVYVRESFTDDFAPIPLAPNTVPTLEQGQWAQALLLESVEGPRKVEISSFDLDKVNALLANLGAEPPAQDLAEQVPAGAWEAPRGEPGEAPRVEAGEAQDQPEAGSAEPAELRSRLGRCLNRTAWSDRSWPSARLSSGRSPPALTKCLGSSARSVATWPRTSCSSPRSSATSPTC